MSISISVVAKLTERLSRASIEQDVENILNEFSNCISMDWFVYAISQLESLNTPSYHVLTNANAWIQEYAEQNYQSNDPVVKYVLTHQTPVIWDTFESLEGYNSEEQLAVMERAAENGMRVGFSIPCNSFAQFAVLSFAHSDQTISDEFNTIMPHASMFAHQLLETTQRIKNEAFKGGGGGGINLTAREMECLMWGSEGKTAWEISKIIGVTERTVVFHFTNATEKLNASSRQHAISKALLMGIIKPNF